MRLPETASGGTVAGIATQARQNKTRRPLGSSPVGAVLTRTALLHQMRRIGANRLIPASRGVALGLPDTIMAPGGPAPPSAGLTVTPSPGVAGTTDQPRRARSTHISRPKVVDRLWVSPAERGSQCATRAYQHLQRGPAPPVAGYLHARPRQGCPILAQPRQQRGAWCNLPCQLINSRPIPATTRGALDSQIKQPLRILRPIPASSGVLETGQ